MKEKIWKQYNVLRYRIDLYFHDHKLAIEIDENGHSDRKFERQKAMRQEIVCNFIRVDPVKEDYDIFRATNEILRHIKQSFKKTLTEKFQWDY